MENQSVRCVNRICAASAPMEFGDSIDIKGVRYTVDQDMSGNWFLRAGGVVVCRAFGMVNFIGEIVRFNEGSMQ